MTSERDPGRKGGGTRRALSAGLGVGAALAAPATAGAADFTVNQGGDIGLLNGCEPPAPGGNGCTLREAMTAADNGSGPDRVLFAAGVTGTLTLNGNALPAIDEALEIVGPGAAALRLDQTGGDRFFTITTTSNTDVTISGLRLEDTSAVVDGAAIHATGGPDLRIEDAEIVNNSTAAADADGGALYQENGTLVIAGSTFSGNSTTGASSEGGAIFANTAFNLIEDSTLSGNFTSAAGSDGGALRSLGPQTIIRGSTLSGNHTDQTGSDGGAIYSSGLSLSIENSILSGNGTLGSSGGAVRTIAGTAIENSTFTGNSTAGVSATGGAIDFFDPTASLDVDGSSFTLNSTTGNDSPGGAVYASGDAFFEGTTLSGNRTEGAASYGGAIGTGSVIELGLTGSTLSGNRTEGDEAHGGALALSDSIGTLLNSTVSGNRTQGQDAAGGGVYAEEGVLRAEGMTVSGNSTGGSGSPGGGIYAYDSDAQPLLIGSIVAGNTAPVASGPDLHSVEPGDAFDSFFSLVGDSSGAAFGATTGSMFGVDPQLGPLADNGGPTLTHRPAPTSPVIDQGSIAPTVAADQRGQPRLFDNPSLANGAGGAADMGAVELQFADFPAAPPPAVKKKKKKCKKKPKGKGQRKKKCKKKPGKRP
jgi:hypothetical protein